MAINNCVFSGNIGGDCEVRVTQNGKTVANFSLPVKQGYGDHEKTSWVRCILLGKMAENIPQYLHKGAKVTVTGEFVLNEWQDQQGQKRTSAELIVRDLDLPPKPQGQQPQHGYQQPAQQQAPAQQYQQPAQQVPQQQPAQGMNQNGTQQSPYANNPMPQQQSAPPGSDAFNDSIPFVQYLKHTFI